MFIALVVLSSLLALAFGAAGGMKVAKYPRLMDGATRLGFSHGAYQLIGVAELAGAVGLLVGLAVAWLGAAAAAGLTLLTIGAAITHARAKDPFSETAPSLVFILLSAAAFALRLLTA